MDTVRRYICQLFAKCLNTLEKSNKITFDKFDGQATRTRTLSSQPRGPAAPADRRLAGGGPARRRGRRGLLRRRHADRHGSVRPVGRGRLIAALLLDSD